MMFIFDGAHTDNHADLFRARTDGCLSRISHINYSVDPNAVILDEKSMQIASITWRHIQRYDEITRITLLRHFDQITDCARYLNAIFLANKISTF